ncbi:hypothetical protein [Actinomadura flavalba]|uniref:hypothetical protein n=1 Tax=Actinomadura flavalba TaxID=1120938 RepID=UPI00038111A7|nr:hypothetical protein [Actinomadura flavalba]
MRLRLRRPVSWSAAPRGVLLRHGPFLLLLVLAGSVRALALAGYPGPLWFGDSPGYLRSGIDLSPGELRPSGYPFLIWLLRPFESFTVLVAVQHLMGLATGALVYALVYRAGRAAWPGRAWAPGLVATALTMPVLLPTLQISLEHMLMAEALFTFVLLAAFAVVLWSPGRMPWWAGVLAGFLMGYAALTRSAGLPFIALLLLAMLVRRAGWRAVTAAVAAFAVPVVGYMFWFQSVYGQFAMASSNNIWLYGRVAGFADCSIIKPDPELAVMCPKRTDPRYSAAFAAMWTADSPFRAMDGWVYGADADRLAGEFTRAAIRAQPGDYAAVIVRDTVRSFAWERELYPNPFTQLQYFFQDGERWPDARRLLAEDYAPDGSGEPLIVDPYARWMRAYQAHADMPGTILGVLLLGGLAGGAVALARPGPRRVRRAVLHWVRSPMVPWGVSLALLVVPAATADFDYRYIPPATPFACLALGLALLVPRRAAAGETATPPPVDLVKAPRETASEPAG